MTPDAHTIALLESQCRELTAVLVALESHRTALSPQQGTRAWRGAARYAYDAALESLRTTMGAGCAALRAARDNSRLAIDELIARG